MHLLINETYIGYLIHNFKLIDKSYYYDIYVTIIVHPKKYDWLYIMFDMILYDNCEWLDLFFDTYREKLNFYGLYCYIINSFNSSHTSLQNRDIIDRVLAKNIKPCIHSIKCIIDNDDYQTLELFVKYNIDINLTSNNKKMVDILNTLDVNIETLLVLYKKN
jgi:hypothetical protein